MKFSLHNFIAMLSLFISCLKIWILNQIGGCPGNKYAVNGYFPITWVIYSYKIADYRQEKEELKMWLHSFMIMVEIKRKQHMM